MACVNNMAEVALNILKYPDECKLDQIDSHGNTALILACSEGITSVALEILKHPDKCGIDCINKMGDTALIQACYTQMIEVVLVLLKYSTKDTLNRMNEKGDTALIIMTMAKMESCITSISQHDEYSSDKGIIAVRPSETIDTFLHLIQTNLKEREIAIIARENELKLREDTLNIVDAKIKTKLDSAYAEIKTKLDAHIKQKEVLVAIREACVEQKEADIAIREEYIKIQKEHNETQKKQLDLEENILSMELVVLNEEKIHLATIKKQLNTHECLICFENTSNNIFLPKCNHILHMCNMCEAAINKICPLCRAESKSFIKCYTA